MRGSKPLFLFFFQHGGDDTAKIEKAQDGAEYVEYPAVVRFYRNVPNKAGMHSFEVIVDGTLLTDGVLNHRKDWIKWAWEGAV